MKVLAAILFLFSVSALAEGNTQTGNTINVNVGKGCCPEKPCKPKTVTKVVEKRIEVPVIVEVTKTVEKPVYIDREVEKKVTVVKRIQKKNHISLLGGFGPTRIDKPQNDRVDLLRGPVGGAMYQRDLSESWGLGIQLQTNQTVLVPLTYSF